MMRVIVLSPGRPNGALALFSMTAKETLGRGVYQAHAEIGLWIVAIRELPATRETLALRLLGRGPVLQRAADELLALPPHAWERSLLDVLLHWRVKVVGQPTRDEEDEEFMMATQQTWAAVSKQIREEGISQGISKGLETLVHQFERRLGRALDRLERDTLAARLGVLGAPRLGDVVLDLDAAALAKWLSDPAAT